MNLEGLTYRRATLDDLADLRRIWESAKLPVEEFEKRFTEFQLAIDENGTIVATMALYHTKQQGMVHSEIYSDREWEPALRAKLWERISVIAKNYGLLRLWTQGSVSFWREQGWKDPDFKALSTMPPIFGHPHAGWLTLPMIKDTLETVEKQFELFAQSQRESNDRTLEQARKLRMLAMSLVILITIGLLAMAAYTFFRWPRKKRVGSNSSAW